jgi:hypothetical protein
MDRIMFKVAQEEINLIAILIKLNQNTNQGRLNKKKMTFNKMMIECKKEKRDNN